MGTSLGDNTKGHFGPILNKALPSFLGRFFSYRASSKPIRGVVGLEQELLAIEDVVIEGSFPG